MNLLHEIRDDLVSESAGLSNTLRKARILAHEIDLPELEQWVRSELAGYSDPDTVPEYRRFQPANVGRFHGPFGSQLTNQPLPTTMLPEPLKSFAESMVFQQSVSELEELLSMDSPLVPWPIEAVILAREHITVEGMELAGAHKPIPKHAIAGILDSIRNRLLDFVLDVPITDNELQDGTFDRSSVRNVFHTHIHGSQNAIAVGENVSQALSQVSRGHLPSLLQYLRDQGIDEDDVLSLKQALAAEPEITEKELGPRVASWLGGMINKAASGTWDIAVETAPKLLLEALGKHYGW
ncbi:MAG: hypothetical protein F4X22_02810 [Gemmatimonadales bacterium]|nr:hypothetical protein [Candidatus Palauibacter denitrificans]